MELSLRRGLDLLAALSVRVVKVREESPSRLEAETFDAITCPHCGTWSRDTRYVDKGPGARAYFICRRAGSFHPE